MTTRTYFIAELPPQKGTGIEYAKKVQAALAAKQMIGTLHGVDGRKWFTFLMPISYFIKETRELKTKTSVDTFEELFSYKAEMVFIAEATNKQAEEILTLDEFLSKVLETAHHVVYDKTSFEVKDDDEEWE